MSTQRNHLRARDSEIDSDISAGIVTGSTGVGSVQGREEIHSEAGDLRSKFVYPVGDGAGECHVTLTVCMVVWVGSHGRAAGCGDVE